MLINESKNHLISIGSDKLIKIWDLRNTHCLLNISDRNNYKPENLITSAYFDEKLERMLLGSRKINPRPVFNLKIFIHIYLLV